MKMKTYIYFLIQTLVLGLWPWSCKDYVYLWNGCNNDLCIYVLHLKLWMLALIQGLALQSQGSFSFIKEGSYRHAIPLKCLPFFLKGCLAKRNRRCSLYTFFLQCSKYILAVSSKQCVHALYPLFDCPERLLRAGQSLIVTKSNARRLNSSYLCSSHTRIPGPCHNCKSSSTNGLWYTSMSLPGCFGPWINTGIIMNFRFMHNQGGRL